MTMRHTYAIAATFLLGLAACDRASPSKLQVPDDVAFRSGGPYDYCDVFTCERCPSTGCPPGGHAVHYCCNEVDCEEVPAGTTCPTGEFQVICNWGMTNVDGTFTCYDDT